jgi:hypothetical protein
VKLDSTKNSDLDLKALTRPQLLAGGAMVVTAAAAFLPWVSVFGISVIGVRGDGLITLIAALAGLASLAFGTAVIGRERLSRVARQSISGVAAGITVLTGFSDMNNFAAMGLYLTLLAGIAWVVALVWEANEHKKANAAQI